MIYCCQSCKKELPDLWRWKLIDPSISLMVVTCPNCNNEFIRLEHDPDTPSGFRVTPSRIIVPQRLKGKNQKGE